MKFQGIHWIKDKLLSYIHVLWRKSGLGYKHTHVLTGYTFNSGGSHVEDPKKMCGKEMSLPVQARNSN